MNGTTLLLLASVASESLGFALGTLSLIISGVILAAISSARSARRKRDTELGRQLQKLEISIRNQRTRFGNEVKDIEYNFGILVEFLRHSHPDIPHPTWPDRWDGE